MDNTYQIKITLKGTKPPVWRRILVKGSVTMHTLHETIQITMGWFNYHLYDFQIGDMRIGLPDDEMFPIFGTFLDATKVELRSILRMPKDKCNYMYDFGDGWEHQILCEKILPEDKAGQLPRCIKGKRNCPPEDCGGVWGYEELLEKIRDTRHPEHEEMVEWLGDDYDPEEFDIEEINGALELEFGS